MRVVTEAVVDADRLADILAPRDGFVREKAAEPDRPGVFELDHGPVTRYRRTVEVTPADDPDGDAPDSRAHVRQTVDFKLAAPLFAWFFTLQARRDAGRLGRPRRMPWWAPPHRLDTHASLTLDALAGAAYVIGYLGTILTQTFTYTAAEFGVDKRGQGISLAVVRADVVISLVVVALADRRGRRRLLLLCCTLGTVISAAAALSPTVQALIATQVVARGFVTAAVVLIGIIAVEEMPAGSRAYAISLLSMAGALGAGACVLALPLADVGRRGWRLLYVLPLLGLIIIRQVGRHLPESSRFGRPHTETKLGSHAKRLWLLAASTFLLALFTVPAGQFQNEFLRDERGFSAARISLFTILTATPGAIGVIIGGRLADVRGRRIVGAVGIAGGVGCTVLMFISRGWPLWAWSVAGSIVGAATIPALGVYGPELFPTSLRGKANGLIYGLGRLGSVVGLVAVGVLARRIGTLPPAFAIMALGPAVLAVLVIVAYPETAGRELEELNPEDAPAGPGRTLAP